MSNSEKKSISPDHEERLITVAKYALPLVLGGIAVKNIRERHQVNHVSYWEASKSFMIDIIRDGQRKSSRLSGTLLGGSTPQDIKVKLYEGFEYTESAVKQYEEAFLPEDDVE